MASPAPPGPITSASPGPTAGTGGPAPSDALGSATAGATVPIDPTLLELLPATVGGLPVVAVSEPSGADDPGLVETLDRMAQAIVVDPASDAFAYASVIVVRPGVLDDSFFRSWRDSFDEGACSQAGGVTGHAQATIAGRTAYIGRCDGGILTYHVRLPGIDTIVSASSLGESRLGEQLLAGLRP